MNDRVHRYANREQVEAVYDTLDCPMPFRRICNRLRLTDTQCDSALRALRAQGRVVKMRCETEVYRRAW